MPKKTFILFFVFFSSFTVYSQWKSSDIPDSLKRNADVVIRRQTSDYRIEGVDRIALTENVVITILNEQGMRYANLYESYDKNSKIEYVKGVVYDDNGKITKKIKKSDFKDISMVSDFSLFEDNRLIFNEIYALSYPFTVEYEFKKVVNTAFYIPSWFPQGYRVGVQKASLQVTYPKSNPVRYKQFNVDLPKSSISEDDNNILLWEINNRKPFAKEPYAPSSFNILPAIFLATSNFLFDGYEGSLISWNSYGEWLTKLLGGRQYLTEKTIVEIRNLTKDAKSVAEKVNIVYKYLQSHSRYVSIQLGIGGFQPFPASDVEKYGYGDCKALTNFMLSLLKAIGIESYYCEIGVNRSRIEFEDFPEKSQTDHVILCVPIQKDTIWLECTNQNTPFGYISHVKQNQKVVFVDGVNSRLVNMPKADVRKNVQSRSIHIRIDSLANASGEMLTSVSGAEIENLMPEYWSSKKDQLEIVQKKYTLPGAIFNGLEYKIEEFPSIKIQENISFTTNKLVSVTGKRFFLPVNPFVFGRTIPSKSKKRNADVSIEAAYTHIDTIVYSIPKGYKVEFLPKTKSISGLFGIYESTVSIEGEKLIATRKYAQNRAKYPSSEYNNFVDFLSEVSKNDKQQIVLVKI